MKIPSQLRGLGNSRNLKILLIIVVALATTLAVSINNRSSGPQKSNSRTAATDKLINAARQALDNDSNNPDRYAALCNLYLQKVRETADVSYYKKCDDLLVKATKTDPNNAEVTAARASVAYGRHSFSEGLSLSQKARQINPNQVSYYGLAGDGQVELGQYEEAVKSFQAMVNKKPALNSYNRVAYIREIYGDIEGAKTALQSAVSAGSSFPENVAFSQVELGKLQSRHDLGKAEETYQQALQTLPDYPPALEGLGKAAFARKDYKKAAKHFQQALDILPIAQYSKALGDTYSAAGDKTKAEQQYYLTELAFNKSTSGGVNNDYEFSVYLSQQNKDNQKAIELAKKAVTERPNIFSSDALAWALYRDGRFAEAQAASMQALRLGENEPSIVYHAGMIAEKLGQKEQAKRFLQKAIEQDNNFLESHFSLLDRKEAADALARLK